MPTLRSSVSTIHPDGTPGSDRISDWGSAAQAGQQFVVADKKGPWTAIWYSGSKVWFHNPDGRNTVPARDVTIVKPAGTEALKVYGTNYPDAAEDPAGLSPSPQAPPGMQPLPPARPTCPPWHRRRRTTSSPPAARSSSAPRGCTPSRTATGPP
ncbi:hypothetical protein GCM10010254_20430 [Streptomyces chromofuscus]|nr:hypothetical protein GCM10010254_20430 [Streptomyces chromofuscus]